MRIKNWSRFQHFKDRRPPWIKLYRELLDDLEWHRLPPASAKVLVSIWLLASEDDGEIPTPEVVAFRLRVSVDEINTALSTLSHWLEQDDIKMIPRRYQVDTPETETETDVDDADARGAEAKKDASRRDLGGILPSEKYDIAPGAINPGLQTIQPVSSTTMADAPAAPPQPPKYGQQSASGQDTVPDVLIIRLFDEVRAETFGDAMARPWPAGTDLGCARRWLEAGLDLETARGVFRAIMARTYARGGPPPGTLSYFDNPIANAIAAKNQPMPKGDPSDSPLNQFRSGPKPTKTDRVNDAIRRAAIAGGYAGDGQGEQAAAGPDAGPVLPIAPPVWP